MKVENQNIQVLADDHVKLIRGLFRKIRDEEKENANSKLNDEDLDLISAGLPFPTESGGPKQQAMLRSTDGAYHFEFSNLTKRTIVVTYIPSFNKEEGWGFAHMTMRCWEDSMIFAATSVSFSLIESDSDGVFSVENIMPSMGYDALFVLMKVHFNGIQKRVKFFTTKNGWSDSLDKAGMFRKKDLEAHWDGHLKYHAQDINVIVTTLEQALHYKNSLEDLPSIG